MQSPQSNNANGPPSDHGYCGIAWDRKRQRWYAKSYHDGTRIILGTYPNAHQAAVAYNHASFLQHGSSALVNSIDSTQLPSPARQAEIQADVAHRLRRRGMLGPVPTTSDPATLTTRVSPTSGYRGVYPHCSGRWRAEIKHQGHRRSLGYYDSPREAAVAFNHAATVLYGNGVLINTIPYWHEPTAQRQAEIQAKVDAQLKKPRRSQA